MADASGTMLSLKPFAAQYDRRTAVYVPTFTPAGWEAAKPGYLRAQAEAVSLSRRTIDTVYLGEMQPERDHGVDPGRTEAVNWNGRSARRLRQGDVLHLKLARRPGEGVLRVVVWGGDVDRVIAVTVDGSDAGTLVRRGPSEDRFASIDHPLPSAGKQGRREAVVTLTARTGEAVIYEVRMLAAADGIPVQTGA